MDNQERNARRKASREANKARRAGLVKSSVQLKLKPSKAQAKALDSYFLQAKWLRNSVVSGEHDRNYKNTEVLVHRPRGVETESLTMPAALRQGVIREVAWNEKSLKALRKNRRRAGFGTLRTNSRKNNIPLNSVGNTHLVSGKKVRLLGVGWVKFLGAKQLEDRELGGGTLVRRPSGYYLNVLTWREPPARSSKPKPPVGLDFGIATNITTSDGVEWSVAIGESERLKRLQRKLQRQKKGSNSRHKTLMALRKEYERLGNKKDDAASKLVAALKGHEFVAFQDENLASWKRKRWFGGAVRRSAMGRVKARLKALPGSRMVGRFEPTTKACRACGKLNSIALSERVYRCSCGYAMPRDRHAALNILELSIEQHTPEELGGAPVEQARKGSGVIPAPDTKEVDTLARKPETSAQMEGLVEKEAAQRPLKRRPLQGRP